jgi:hypothetical protein
MMTRRAVAHFGNGFDESLQTPVCKWLKYHVFYATVGFRTAAAANPAWNQLLEHYASAPFPTRVAPRLA